MLAITEQSHAGTLVVGGLIEEEVFDAAWRHPRVLAADGQVLGGGYRAALGSDRVACGRGTASNEARASLDASERPRFEPAVITGGRAG